MDQGNTTVADPDFDHGSALEKAAPLSPLKKALLNVEKNHANLSDVINMLAKRLEPVLRPAEPQNGSNEGKEVIAKSDFTEQIERHGRKLQNYEQQLRSLLERLEV